MASLKGGYDCEFVEPPPKYLECSICLLILRTPHVISCCGNHFCHACISRIQGDGKPCPLCNEPNFTTFLHKGVVREVNALTIWCSHRQLGCDWEGELGQLEEHLGLVCGYVTVDCDQNCGERFERRWKLDHEMNTCPRRSFEAQLVNLAKKLDDKLAVNKMKLNAVITENQEIKAVNEAMMAELEALRQEVQELKKSQDDIHSMDVPPFYFTTRNYQHHKKVNYTWSSPLFYSHPGGYKMLCRVYVNGAGDGKDTHLSLFVVIRRGEYDYKLKWPFNGIVTIEMFNWSSNKWGHRKKIVFDDNAVIKSSEEPKGRMSTSVLGYDEWISLQELNRNYLNSDMVRFRITEVELK